MKGETGFKWERLPGRTSNKLREFKSGGGGEIASLDGVGSQGSKIFMGKPGSNHNKEVRRLKKKGKNKGEYLFLSIRSGKMIKLFPKSGRAWQMGHSHILVEVL